MPFGALKAIFFFFNLGQDQQLLSSTPWDDERESKRRFERRTVLSRSLEQRNVREEEVTTKTVLVSHQKKAEVMGNFHWHMRYIDRSC